MRLNLAGGRIGALVLVAGVACAALFGMLRGWAARHGDARSESYPVRLCQGVAPVTEVIGTPPPQGIGPCGLRGNACQRDISGVDCATGTGCGEQHWNAWGPIPWQAFAQGEYAGPARTPHLPEYRLRTDDEIDFIYRLTREDFAHPYLMEVGDTMRIESQIDPSLNREVTVQPDGTIDVMLLGEVRVAHRSAQDIRADLNELYKKYYKVTDINVTRLKTQTRLEDLRAAVDARFGFGGQGKRVRVTPDGTISLPAIGVVPATGLTLDEIKREVEARYNEYVEGMGITPILSLRAPRYIFVLGEVQRPGRFDLTGPTTAMQAIALAGGWNNGGNLRQIVVFRRGEDWRLLATKLDVRGALYGTRPQPADEIWLRDSDVVVVPKSDLRRFDDLAELVFSQGIYRVFPISFGAQLINTGGGTVVQQSAGGS
ncbi:MAG: polysaccharide biosynthesis/export family protein [Pirellulaceae bacterium]|nr:polysaccharide biosynthesis/export family protein [Pirellulaceae bacterium]